ncbi:MAG: response regulator [Myxococcota bacterium]
MVDEHSGYTVLVVEDDPTHQLLIRKALNSETSPFSVVQFAGNSEDAEHFARQMSFDVLLVDNRIPGRRGLDMIATLSDEGLDAPFVLMTSAGNEDLAVQAYRTHVADYIIKDPGFWRDLPQTLVRVIEADRARKSEVKLRERLERANARLDELNTTIQLRNEELQQAYETMGDFTTALALALDEPIAAIRKAVADSGSKDEELAGAREALDRVTNLLERIRALPALSDKSAEEMDLEAVFDRVQKDLDARPTS